MIDRLYRTRLRTRSALLAVVLAAAASNAAGCGDTGDTGGPGAPEVPGPDATTPLVDGATPDDGGSPGDGTPGDGAAPGDATPGDAAAEADASSPTGPLSPTYVDYDVNHVLVTGQSNAVASGARPINTLPAGTPFTTAQPYTNLMFDTGVMTSQSCNGSGCPSANYVTPTAFVPLVEPDSFFGGAYLVETISSSMANLTSNLAATQFQFGVHPGYPSKHDMLVSVHGRSGNTYWCLRKGGCNYKPASEIKPFSEGIMQVQAAKSIATGLGKTFVVRAVTTIHGESDHYSYTTNTQEFPLTGTDGTPGKIKDYADGLIEWQQDYEAAIKAVTAQAEPVPLFVSGLSGWTDATYSKVAVMQLDAHVRAPGKVVLVAPGYIFDMAVRTQNPLVLECLHFSVLGQKHLGEYMAKAYAQVVLKGQPWEPVRPKQITRAGSVITVQYHVPVPPLTIDTTRVAAIQDYGFTYTDDSGAPPAIASVAVTGPDTVTLTLASAPTGANRRLRYALNQPLPGCTGPGIKFGGGARGNLRDSDATPSLNGFDLFNWGVQFDVTVP